MLVSTASLSNFNNPRLFKALIDHFASIYPADRDVSEARFRLGSNQVLKIARQDDRLTFAISYSEISRFASISRALNSRCKRYLGGKPLDWSTERFEQTEAQILNLPRPDFEDLPVQTVLADIFHLGSADDPATTERWATVCVARLYPVGQRRLDLRETAVADLAEWLSYQSALGNLNVADPEVAASLLISMLYGDLAVRLNVGQALPERTKLVEYLTECLAAFMRAYGPVTRVEF